MERELRHNYGRLERNKMHRLIAGDCAKVEFAAISSEFTRSVVRKDDDDVYD